MTEDGFVAESDSEGGLIARAIGTSIVAKDDDRKSLCTAIRDAARCHFDDAIAPIAIHIRLGPR